MSNILIHIRRISILLTPLLTSVLHADTSAVDVIMNQLFSYPAVQLPAPKAESVEKLLHMLITLSPYQRQQVAEQLHQELKDELQQLNKMIEARETAKKPISQELFFKRFILKQQIKHFSRMIARYQKELSWFARATGTLAHAYRNAFAYTRSLLGEKEAQSTIDQTAQLLRNYIDIERKEILFNYTNLIRFLHTKPSVPFPDLINFWDTEQLQAKIKKRSRTINPTVDVQMVELLISLGAQAIAMAGGEAAVQWIDKLDEELFKSIKKQETVLSDSWKRFQKNLNNKKTAFLKALGTAFTSSQKALADDYQKTQKRLQEELLYLNRSVNLAQPIQRALTDPLGFDLLFAAARMVTPAADKQPWYNVFQVKGSDWEFDTNTNSFWQNGLVPMPQPPFWKKKGKWSLAGDDPAANSIFTEWITDGPSYDIEVECTLITCTYPFFAGVMFNRGRWISGDDERLWWSRLVGLYGTETTKNDPKTRAINLSFGEQDIFFPTENKPKKVTSPLQQIMENKTKPINFKLPQTTIQSLVANPQTFVFAITNKPGSATITLNKKDGTKRTQLYSTTVSDLKEYLYKYHGIGFIASGCQASFKIIKPAALTYSQKERDAFDKTVQKLVSEKT